MEAANGPSRTHPRYDAGKVTVEMFGDGNVYVPSTPSPPNPVTGSKIGDRAILLITISDKMKTMKGLKRRMVDTYGTFSLSPSLAQSQNLEHTVSA